MIVKVYLLKKKDAAWNRTATDVLRRLAQFAGKTLYFRTKEVGISEEKAFALLDV